MTEPYVVFSWDHGSEAPLAAILAAQREHPAWWPWRHNGASEPPGPHNHTSSPRCCLTPWADGSTAQKWSRNETHRQ